MKGIVPYSFGKDAIVAALVFFRRDCHIFVRPGYVPILPGLTFLQGLMELTFAVNPNAVLEFTFGLRITARLIGPVELENLLKKILAPDPPDRLWRGIEMTEASLKAWKLDPSRDRGDITLKVTSQRVTFGDVLLWQSK